MLDSFWNSIEIQNVSDLNYTIHEPYPTEEQKDAVLQKIDWVILKLHRIKEHRKYDYDMVLELKNSIVHSDCSLTTKGIEFLNSIASDLRGDSF